MDQAKLEIRHLRSIIAISEEAGLTGAGRVLHLTQSALSHQLREIQERLSTKLFVRVGHRLVPTPVGEKLVGRARKILADLRSAELQLHDQEGGVIRISTECHTCYHWLPSVMAQLKKKFPKLEIQVNLAATRHPLPSLLAGELDLALMASRTNSPQVRETPLFRDELQLVVSPGHPLAKRKFVKLEDLAAETVVVYPPRSESSLSAFLRADNVQPAAIVEMPLTEAIIEMVRAGEAVGYLAKWAIAPYVLARKVIGKRITANGIHREWAAVSLASQPMNPQLTQLIRLLGRYPFAAKG